MNHRQAKKKERNQWQLIDTYNGTRKYRRKTQRKSIEWAREEHRNFWEEWTRGYPNRFPYRKWFKSMPRHELMSMITTENDY